MKFRKKRVIAIIAAAMLATVLLSSCSARVQVAAMTVPLQRNINTSLSLGGGSSSDTKITLVGEGNETATPFSVSGMLPGDSASKSYTVKVNDPNAETIIFSAVKTRGELPGDKMTLTVTSAGNTVYGGKLGDVPETAVSLDGAKSAVFVITVALDTSAGNEYAGLEIAVDFIWKYSSEETIYSVTYTDGVEGEEVFADQVYNVVDGSATPAFDGTPERVGFVFAGWYPEVSDKVTNNVTYTAQWKARVTIHADGATTELLVDEGGTMDRPAVPAKNGYGFAGWYTDPGFAHKFDFNAPITSEVNLYARFFLWGDVDDDGVVTAVDSDLINLYIMEVDNPNIRNMIAGRTVNPLADATANDANNILLYVMEAIDELPIVGNCAGYEFDLENDSVIAPGV